ncbi:PE domain-containing protein [Goodfellowiella coeruleoviolacea]|uniref:PE family protein n=1 Tax=Goodfellowiella coeruleoviolacea TaxID=334858 RepID=A0AAE3GBQ6_9PSEU|nr:PE domain-containing protein [Goodfellowiella coeruleoviolacea]MCP2165356.1 PE family protein [Goodfellowiella coeruleoviolacea]
MPFFENAADQLLGLGQRQDVGQPAGPAPYGGQVKLVVSPDQVLTLKQEFETLRDEVRDFLFDESENLAAKPMGADPVSYDVADTVGQNAETAVECARNYVAQLNGVIDSLEQQAKQYALVEDANTNAFRTQGA